MADTIKVAIKVRPLIRREIEAGMKVEWRVESNSMISEISAPDSAMKFDHVFGEEVSNDTIFQKLVQPIVADCLRGFNGTVMAYGQTASGKTHIMMGEGDTEGVIGMAVGEIFNEIERQQDREFLIRVSYVEIYNEKIQDLLESSKAEKTEIKLKELPNGEIYMNCKEFIASKPNQIMGQIDLGNENRCVGETAMNDKSSRSHSIFRIIIESRAVGATETDAAVQIGTLNLVDLAGSERADQTGATGSRFKEGTFINKSLFQLSLIIKRLSEGACKHVNYRDSKLTRLLQNSIGGNAKSVIICAVTPAVIEETRNTLGFANRAKTVKNEPIVNEVMTDTVMIKRLQKEIAQLHKELKNAKATNNLEILQKIEDRQVCFIHPSALRGERERSETERRKTWAPMGSKFVPSKLDLLRKPQKVENSATLLPPPEFFASKPSLHEVLNSQTLSDDLANEIFVPGEMVEIEQSPNSSKFYSIHTPQCFKQRLSIVQEQNEFPLMRRSLSYQDKINHLEHELQELQEFTKLEKLLHVHENIPTCQDEIKRLERDLECTQEKCQELEEKISGMENLKVELVSAQEETARARREKEVAERKQKEAEDTLNSKTFEFETLESRSKQREKDLLELIESSKGQSGEEEGKMEKLSVTLRDTESRLLSLEKALADERQVFDKTLVEKESQISNLNEKVEAASEKLRVLESSVVDLEKTNQELSRKLNLIENNANKAFTEPKELKSLLESLQSVFGIQAPNCSFGPDDLMCDFTLNGTGTGTIKDEEEIEENEALDKTFTDTPKEEVLGLTLEVQESHVRLTQMQESLNQEIEKHQKELRNLKEQLEEADNNKKVALQANLDISKKLQDLQKTMNEKERKDLDAFNQVMTENKNLKDKISALEENNESQFLIEKLKEEKAALQKEYEKLLALTSESNILVEKLREEKSVLQQEYDAVSSQTMEYVEENESLRAQRDAISVKNTALSAQIEELLLKTREAEAVRDQLKATTDKFEDISAKLAAKNSQLEEMLCKIEELSSNNDEAKVEMSQYNELVGKIEESSAKAKQFETKIAELNTTIESLQEENSSLKNARQVLEENLKNLEGRLKTLEPLKAKIDICNAHIAEKDAKIASQETKLTELEGIIKEGSEKAARVAALEAENSELQSRLQGDSDNLQQEVSELRTELSRLMGVVDEKQLQEKTFSVTQSQMESDLAELTEKLDQKMAQMDVMEKDMAEKTVKISALETAIIEAQKTIKEKEDLVEAKETELNESKIAAENLKLLEKQYSEKLADQITNMISMMNSNMEQLREKSQIELEIHQARIFDLSELILDRVQVEENLKKECARTWKQANDQIQELSQEISECNNEKAVLRTEIESAQSQIRFYDEHTIPKLKHEVSDLKSCCTELQSKLSQAKENESSSSDSVKSLKVEVEALKVQTQALRDTENRLADVQKALEKERKLTTGLKEDVQEGLEAIEKSERKCLNIEKLLKNKENELKLKDREIKDLQSDLKRVEKELQESKGENDASVKRLQDELENLKQKYQILRLEQDELKRSKDNRRQSRQSFFDGNRSGLRSTQTHNEGSQTDPVDEKCQCKLLDSKIQGLKKEAMLKQLKLDNFDTQLQYMMQKERKKTEEWKQKAESFGVEVTQLKSILNSRVCKSCEAFQLLMARHKADEEALKTQLQVLESKYESAKLLCRARNEKIRELERECGKENLAHNNQTPKVMLEIQTQTEQEMIPTFQHMEQVALIREELDALHHKYERCKRLCMARKESHTKMEAKYAEIQKDNSDLQDMIDQLEAQVKALNSRNQN